MEIGSTARMAVLPAIGEAPRVTDVAAPEAVRTELPAASTAQQPGPAPGDQRSGDRPRGNAAPDIARELTIDASTQEVVFRAIDKASGEVVRQVPDQALLRIKAYAREMRQTGSRPVQDDRVERIA